MPRIHKVPEQMIIAYRQKEMEMLNKLPPTIPSVNKNISSWFTKQHWETIFPYAKASAVFTHDGEPFWRYEDFIASIEWMNNHPNPIFHGFGTDSSDNIINILEVCAFSGNFHQETGDPSISVPYPWGWPKVEPSGQTWEGSAGGALGILEGAIAQPFLGSLPTIKAERTGPTLQLSSTEKKVIATPENTITGVLTSMIQLNQPQFGLGTGTGNGAVFQPGLVAVSDNGTLWGDEPRDTKFSVRPTSEYKQSTTDRNYSALGPYAQYGGRGAIQLSYNYNYSDCSMALFGDYRLAKYPNLIITTDRENFNGNSYYFGFPGPNPNGNNQLPYWIKASTPPARMLAYITCFWFWMDRNRSGRKISCHECMLKPYTHGITGTNMIINNQSGCSSGWAANKNLYYKRICKILGVSEEIINKSIVCPPNKEVVL